jgi:hypothetical protein
VKDIIPASNHEDIVMLQLEKCPLLKTSFVSKKGNQCHMDFEKPVTKGHWQRNWQKLSQILTLLA